MFPLSSAPCCLLFSSFHLPIFTRPCHRIYSFGSKQAASLQQQQEAAVGQKVMSKRKNTPHESLSDYFNSLMDE